MICKMTDLFGQEENLIEQQIKCVEREISMRQRVYPNWINAKKMSAGKAEYEIQMMHEVVKSIKEFAKLKQQLAIAVEDLYVIANNANPDFNRMEYAEKSLQKIKELNK